MGNIAAEIEYFETYHKQNPPTVASSWRIGRMLLVLGRGELHEGSLVEKGTVFKVGE